MQPIEVKCDHCQHEFTVSSLEELSLEDGINKNSFTCPQCKKEYVAFYTDKAIRNNLTEIAKLRWDLNKATTVNKKQKLTGKIQKLIQENNQRHEQLKKELL